MRPQWEARTGLRQSRSFSEIQACCGATSSFSGSHFARKDYSRWYDGLIISSGRRKSPVSSPRVNHIETRKMKGFFPLTASHFGEVHFAVDRQSAGKKIRERKEGWLRGLEPPTLRSTICGSPSDKPTAEGRTTQATAVCTPVCTSEPETSDIITDPDLSFVVALWAELDSGHVQQYPVFDHRRPRLLALAPLPIGLRMRFHPTGSGSAASAFLERAYRTTLEFGNGGGAQRRIGRAGRCARCGLSGTAQTMIDGG
jgi:hypothetical protein